ncbi:MAG: Gfo/Idh/MocA family oxidoreductase [Clostridia bacterium]|nr:Gfo/Idh/MocA family oxidoreductase [Clostridia bacterium]
MKKLNVAIIGQGRSGRDIHGAYFKSADNTKYNVVAVVDAIEARRTRAKEEYPNATVHADYTELFGRTDIDLVVNSTFSQQHAAITIDLLNNGFNVVCEKPFAKTYEDGCRMVNTAEKNGKMLNAFQQSRFAPYFVKIREILASGILGEVIEIRSTFGGFARRWDWQTSLDHAAGNVRNTGPHPLDQALALLDFADDISVYSKLACYNDFGDAEDYAKIILTAPQKPLAELTISSYDGYAQPIYIISCKNGCLKSTANKIEIKYFDPKTAPEQKHTVAPLEKEDGTPAYCSETLDWKTETFEVNGSVFTKGTDSYYNMIYDYLVNGKEMEVNPYQVLKQLKIIDLVHAQNPLTIKPELRK